MITLGFDTSNYTTSVAAFDGAEGVNASALLDVAQGALGLRQSEALFAHVKRLPELSDRLFASVSGQAVCAIGASTRPREVEGSYMPCFLAGESQARVLAAALQMPLFCFSHQQGHIAAALWSCGHMELFDRPFLAWHLSGGTTELLLVEPNGAQIRAQKLGGTTDLSAGQLIDRTGVMLGLSFPCGRALDALSKEADTQEHFKVKVKDLSFSLSGVQNKLQEYYARTQSPQLTARYCLLSLASALRITTSNALRRYPAYPIVFSGGVSSNSLLRECLADFLPLFCAPEYARDNAMGAAILAWRKLHGSNRI